MKILVRSDPLDTSHPLNNDPIHLYTQFFIPQQPRPDMMNMYNKDKYLKKQTGINKERYDEIKFCLRKNVENDYVDKIYLLNERIYTDNELGISSDKIIQIVIDRRFRFSDAFNHVNQHKNTPAYAVVLNSDIFVNDTIKHIKNSRMHEEKTMIALLRFNYDPNIEIQNTPLFGPRFDSQDTWILHSNMNVPDKHMKAFQFEMGKLACDNKLIYLFLTLGYNVINDPLLIKTFHYQMSPARTYTIKDRIGKPWGCVVPARISPEFLIEILVIAKKMLFKCLQN